MSLGRSSLDRRRFLQTTALGHFFDDRLFSAYQISAWKPAPDLFLHAAENMRVEPANCLVVEDSTHGVEAAVAAGMRPIGFTGGSHSYPGHAETLMAAGAETTVNRMVDLAPTINALKSWRLD